MLKPLNIFHTPKDWAELQKWLEGMHGPEAVMATTAAMMAWNLAAKTVKERSEQPGIEKVLTLSTAHMPSTKPDFGSLRVVEFQYGYVMWPVEVGDGAGIPKWLLPIIGLANKEECTLVLFEAGVPAREDLTQWEW